MSQILNILSSIGFNWHIALANFINFLIILFLLKKFFFGKIATTINNRKHIIERGLHDAQEGEKLLHEADEKKRIIIRDAEKKKDEIVAQGELMAQSIITSRTEEAEKKIEEKMTHLDEQEKNLKANVEKEFQMHAPSLVARLYAKTLMKELTEEENNRLISAMKVS